MIIAITGGFLLHVLPNLALMILSQTGFLMSVLLFAIIPSKESKSTDYLYWAYIFPAMICGTIGIDITFNVTNVYITTAMPDRLQATAGGFINSVLYLGMAFWLGIGELAVSSTVSSHENMSLSQQYKVGFWVGVGLAAVALLLVTTIRMGKASAQMTADEKANLEQEVTTGLRHDASPEQQN